jgi:Ca2+/Na+ antiporter
VTECFITVYLLMSQGVMADKFLLPSMLNICKKYSLSKPIGGVLIAVGVSIPELTATMLSFQRHGVKMTEFGLALVIGGLAFATSMIPVVAYLLNFGLKVKRPS